MFSFVFLDQFENGLKFALWSFAFRLLQGSGNSGISTVCYSAASDYDQKLTETLIGVVEVVSNLGLGSGPIVGAIFYNYFGFKGPFLFAASLMTLSVFLTCIFLKKVSIKQEEPESNSAGRSLENLNPDMNESLIHIRKFHSTSIEMVDKSSSNEGAQIKEFSLVKKKKQKDRSNQHVQKSGQIEQILDKKTFCNKRIILNCLSIMSISTSYFMIQPYFQPEFKSYGISDLLVGFLFAIYPMGFNVTIPFLNLIPKKMDRRVLIGPSLLISSIMSTFIGHFIFRKSLVLLIIGLSLQGSFYPFGTIIAAVDIQRTIKQKHPNIEKQKISNFAGGLTNFLFNIPKIIGPPLGGFVLDQLDSFSKLVMTYTIATFIAAVFFIILNEPHIIYRNCGIPKSTNLEIKKEPNPEDI